MSSTTRISDLPDNISAQMPTSAFPPPTYNGVQMQPPSNTYAPINIHPNPYGNTPPANGINSIPQPQYISNTKENIKYSLESGQGQGPEHNPTDYNQRLPSRDIPHNTLDYTQDPEIQVNYIPPPSTTQNDYIKEYEQRREPALKQHEKHKKRVKFADDWLTQFQTPILVMFLYFLFQIPLLNKLLYRIFGKTPLYSAEGNLNWMGVALKSIMFGLCYMVFVVVIDYISYL